MKQEEFRTKPTEGLPGKTPPKLIPRSPELQARIDEFNRQIGPAMVESLRRATADKK